MHFYNDLDLNNPKILWLPSISQFERTVHNLNHPSSHFPGKWEQVILLLRFSDLYQTWVSCLILQYMLKKQNCAQTTKLSTHSIVDSYVNFTISCKPSFSQNISILKNINSNWVKATIFLSDFFYVTFRFKCQKSSVHPEASIIKKIMGHLLSFLILF